MATFAPRPPPDIIDIADDSDDEGAAITKKSQPANSSVQEHTFSDFESDDEDEDANEVEHKPLIAPSTDIKGDFEAALEEGFDFDGVFAFSARYAIGAAPNPYLNIDGLGAVGIPLSERDARAIISACVAPPSVKNVASGIWEMPAEKVRFDNPAWDAWAQNTAGVTAATALNACKPVRPSFRLKKLVIHEASSSTAHYKEPIDDDESNTKIGDFIVVLPSVFQGAQLHLHHAGQAKSLNFAHQSGLSTSVVAAYSGVEHTLASVTSGYRLSLVYDILFPITHADFRPTLPEMQGATQKLHNIMLSWKQDTSGEAPSSLACLLQHKYRNSANFRAQSLTGVDALLVSHLYPLARQLKFRIYLAHVQVTVTTTAEAEDTGYEREYGCGYGGGYRRGWGRRRYYDDYDMDEDEEIDEDEFEDDEASREESLVLTRVVDLRGMPVDVDIELEPDDLINGSITDQDPDTEDFEREERTIATRTSVYNRTVLLIWPKDSDADLGVVPGDIYDYACNTLQSSFTVAPTEKERKLVDNLLVCCRIRPQDAKFQRVVQVLRESADRWNDVAVLLRALKVCGVDKHTERLGPEGFVSAYQAFGWAPLKAFYEDAMKNDESNVRRHALLARLTQMAVDEEDTEVSAWCAAQADSILRSLSKIDAAQIPWLADLGLSRGGEFLRDVIFPQLQAQTLGQEFWMPFVQRLQQNTRDIPTGSPDVVRGLISQCVAQTVRDLPAFPTKVSKNTYGYGYPYQAADRHEKSSQAVLDVIKFCVETGSAGLCVGIFDKMRGAASVGDFRPEFPPWLYYTELCASVSLYLQTSPVDAAVFRPFFVDVVDSMISTARTAPNGKTITPCPLQEQHKAMIMIAARKAGGISVLKQRLTADVLKGHDSTTLQGLARSVAKEFPRQTLVQDPVALQAYNDLIIGLVRTAIDTLDIATLVKKPSYNYGFGANMNPSEGMLNLVKFTFDIGAQSQCQRLLLRLVPPPAGSTVPQHVSTVLAPFLPVLRQFLAGQRLDFETEPYKMFAAAVVKAFAEKVMAQKPHEAVPAAQLQGIGCNACADCAALKAFFCSDRTTITFRRVQTIRTHLERYLYVTRAWGVQLATIRSGSPHTLQVTKPASMTALGLWSANSQNGKVMLHGLGDPAAQARILGADYNWVYARINGIATSPVPLANATQTLNAQKRVATAASSTIPAAKKARTS